MMKNRENCSMRHENGNCLPCGGFCTAVNDEICDALHQAYKLEKLPCNIGDIFYRPISWRNEVDQVRVSGLTKKADRSWKIRVSDKLGVQEYKASEIGKSIFYTYEEAEDALKAMVKSNE